MIYHITSSAEWKEALQKGEYSAPSLAQEGFIHASTRAQVVDSANRFYKGKPGLVILCIDPARLAVDLRYELAPSVGQEFPHLYGPLNLEAVTAVVDFPPDPATGTFHLPHNLP